MSTKYQVRTRTGAYREVTLEEVRQIASRGPGNLDVQHINAIAAAKDATLFPLLEQALASTDKDLLRAVASACVRLKLHDLAIELGHAAKAGSDEIACGKLFAAKVYLTDSDRGLARVLANDPLQVFLLNNLLSVDEFDEADLDFAAATFCFLALNASQFLRDGRQHEWAAALMPDAINGLLGALAQTSPACKLSAAKSQGVLDAAAVLQKHSMYKRLDRDTRTELDEICDSLNPVSIEVRKTD